MGSRRGAKALMGMHVKFRKGIMHRVIDAAGCA